MFLFKRIAFSLLLAIGLRTVSAQAVSPVAISMVEGGRDHGSDTPVMVKQYSFHLPVYKYHPISDGGSVAVQLRKMKGDFWGSKGEVLMFDSETGNHLWGKKFKYQMNQIFQENDVILEQRGNKVSRLNPENGAVMWKNKSFVRGIYSEFNLFLGYGYNGTGFESLHGLDLSTGTPLWTRNISGQYGWSRQDFLNDSTLLIVGSGLHTTNLVNGRGWDMPRETSVKKTDMKKVGLALLGGVAVGAMGGMMIPGDLTDMYMNICSNVLYDGDDLFFASRNKISCRTRKGEMVWDQELNPKLSSTSHIFMDGNVLYMINTGYALKYGRKAKLGTPFVAAYDAQTGKQLFIEIWEERKNYITDFLIEGKELTLLYKNKIESYQFSETGLTDKSTSQVPDTDLMDQFVSDELFIASDSTYVPLSYSKDHYFVLTENREVLKLDNDFKLVGAENKELIYRKYMETQGHLFLGNKDKTIVLEKMTDRPVATLNAPVFSVRYGDHLYYSKRHVVFQVDLLKYL